MQSRAFSLMALLVFTAIASISAGCSKKQDKWTQGRPPVYPAAGQVLLDGEPVAEATVTFQPVDPNGKGGSAITDSNGFFEAQTFEPADGLTEGSHLVAIRKTKLIDRNGNEVEVVREPGGIREKDFLPKKYAQFDKSGLQVEVAAQNENDLGKFELKN
ncbi:carboxypeptidase-like regulatory domain-containing protein [Bremerella sp. T1]|uniref:carboxypeptidase-like regulatory domain-containing protein n=1 Tax=Bremerella sp. TYQ1 TaxID=3119568 RepID=UPI001CCD691A|nr:carboxypeptidase-like regulatory domain-containing protein [Bremerella volcania]UBM33814.1 carboxypeptidase-like regulatory domain-containing protein [Bremerella volcania]